MGKKDRYDFDTADDDLGQSNNKESDDNEEETAMDPFESSREDVGNQNKQRTRDTTDTDDAVTTSNSSPANRESQSASEEIPHRVRYDSPKTDRDQKMFYLNDNDLDRLSELERLAETEFDENIHATDVRLAAFRSDLTDSSFLSEMHTIGYGYFDS
jgi:hypothetical protein